MWAGLREYVRFRSLAGGFPVACWGLKLGFGLLIGGHSSVWGDAVSGGGVQRAPKHRLAIVRVGFRLGRNGNEGGQGWRVKEAAECRWCWREFPSVAKGSSE